MDLFSSHDIVKKYFVGSYIDAAEEMLRLNDLSRMTQEEKETKAIYLKKEDDTCEIWIATQSDVGVLEVAK